MMIQTVTHPACASATCPPVDHISTPHTVVAAEGSELAARLRSNGWIARAGWRRYTAGRPAAWLVRFECPSACPAESAA
ncbi:MAG TPA: hypothetical protein VFV93_08750 [Thermomicrobiales bacterium]|nr:hypothetical protein [Thermomicrobiales bacterium]